MKKNSALILAAGRGSRMGESTNDSHKCMTLLKGKSLLDWQLSAIRRAGISNIKVVIGYKGNFIKGDFKTSENLRWYKTNMVSTFFCCKEFKEDTIVSYSDIVYSYKHIEKLIKIKGDIVITADIKWYDLWSMRFDNPLEDAEAFKTENNILKKIGNKNTKLKDIEAQYMGLLKFSPKGWRIAYNIYSSLSKIKQDKIDMTSFLSLLIDKIEIKVVFIKGKWVEVDTINDLKIYKKILKENKNWSHDWR